MDARLSEAEQVYILHGFQQDLRTDGRRCHEYRPITLETSVVDSASGSARVKCGSTDVLVGVKAEIGKPESNADEGSLRFFVDCSANATPEFEGRGGEGIADDISGALAAAVSSNESAFNLRQLAIVPKHYAWTLWVDILLLECGGNLYDLVSFAVKMALRDTQLPNLTVGQSEKSEPIVELSEDPLDTWGIDVTGFPVFVTVSKVGISHALDMSLEEEQVVLSALLFGISPTGQILFMRQFGRGSLDFESVSAMSEFAVKNGKRMIDCLTKSKPTKERVGFL